MDHIERVKEEIRCHWFKDHVAEVRGEEGLQVITWGKPGTNMYRTKYVLSGNNVFVSGDIGEAVYSLTCAATLKNIEDFELHYFTGKLSAFCEERWDFDENLAKKELKEHWEEYELNELEDGQEIYEAILSAIEESSSMESYRAWLMNVYQDTSADSDVMEGVWDFGKKLPHRLIGYWVGLKMVIEQSERKKSKTA
ncbi:hypothetical protein H9649_07515 [Sporosarcina sp. Sa2YVA2]|uniref:EH domain-containing protein n=1 Tax=Sporosarcina quadrami TaxID=2762234 RepID=A0ABR8U8Q8_9BACL|nr:hypothetical protein [Sporosarcina quadrami]MBD7984422.1 hypothetical protein [Sporosarcina quadrami]